MSSSKHVERLQDISYEIRRTRSAKRISLKISEDGRVWVSMPPRVALREAREFVKLHLEDIRRHLAAARQRRDRFLDQKQTLQLPYKGRWFPVRIEHTSSGPEAEVLVPQAEIDLPTADIASNAAAYQISILQSDANTHDRRAVIRAWQNFMIDAANLELPQRTIELARRHNQLVKRISIRDQRSRWGSCSKARRSINLNWRCILFADDVCDYLILHELAHLLHADHSADFWRQVEEWCPDYRRCDNWITAHGQKLMDVTREM